MNETVKQNSIKVKTHIQTLLSQLERLGHWWFYLFIKIFGYYGGVVLLVPVVSCYVLLSRNIHRTLRFYFSRRFPRQSRRAYWWYSFKTVFSFGLVLVDRAWLGIKKDARLNGEFEGYEVLADLIKKGKGVVLLTGHVGNWQSALAHLGDLPVKVHALMQYDQQAAAKHFFDLQSDDGPSFEIIDAEQEFGGMVEASAALSKGDVVTIMGDRYVKGTFSSVDFLGDEVRVPNGAYMLAALSEAPIVILLAAKTGVKKYQLKVWDYYYPEYQIKNEREAMLNKCSKRYMRTIEMYLQKHPFQWYNFYNFWTQ